MYRKPLDTIMYNNLSENCALKKKYKKNPLKGKDNEEQKTAVPSDCALPADTKG